MIRRLYTVNSFVLPILDTAILVIAYGVSFLIKRPGTHHIADIDIYNTFLLIQIISWLLVASYTRLYPSADSPHFIRHITLLLQNWTTLLVLSLAILIALKVGLLFSRGFLLYYYGFFAIGLLLLRLGHFTLIRRGIAGMKRRVLFVGEGAALRHLFDRMINVPHYAVVGISSGSDLLAKITAPSGNGLNLCEKFLDDEGIDEIILAQDYRQTRTESFNGGQAKILIPRRKNKASGRCKSLLFVDIFKKSREDHF